MSDEPDSGDGVRYHRINEWCGREEDAAKTQVHAERMRRDLKITRKLLKKHGYSAGCFGCESSAEQNRSAAAFGCTLEEEMEADSEDTLRLLGSGVTLRHE